MLQAPFRRPAAELQGSAMTQDVMTSFFVACPVCEQPMQHAGWTPKLFKGKPSDAILVCAQCRIEATCRRGGHAERPVRGTEAA
jgi:hypothetical protein